MKDLRPEKSLRLNIAGRGDISNLRRTSTIGRHLTTPRPRASLARHAAHAREEYRQAWADARPRSVDAATARRGRRGLAGLPGAGPTMGSRAGRAAAVP